MYDEDRSGCISKEELASMLRVRGVETSSTRPSVLQMVWFKMLIKLLVLNL
jgi:Ca2+-binding EF-hand superfamily protein